MRFCPVDAVVVTRRPAPSNPNAWLTTLFDVLVTCPSRFRMTVVAKLSGRKWLWNEPSESKRRSACRTHREVHRLDITARGTPGHRQRLRARHDDRERSAHAVPSGDVHHLVARCRHRRHPSATVAELPAAAALAGHCALRHLGEPACACDHVVFEIQGSHRNGPEILHLNLVGRPYSSKVRFTWRSSGVFTTVSPLPFALNVVVALATVALPSAVVVTDVTTFWRLKGLDAPPVIVTSRPTVCVNVRGLVSPSVTVMTAGWRTASPHRSSGTVVAVVITNGTVASFAYALEVVFPLASVAVVVLTPSG